MVIFKNNLRKLSTCFHRQLSSFNSHFSFKKGFTLIELLIVIAILGILAVGVVTAINVIGNLNKATLARAKTFSSQVENALSINQVGKWSFEDGVGSTTFKDISGWENNGSCLGASCPTWKTASECGLGYGGCVEFILGASHYISVTDTDSLRPSTVTVSAWIKTTQTNQGRIVVKPNIVNTNQAYSLNINVVPNKASMYTDKPFNAFATSKTSVNDGNWHFIVGTHDGLKIQIYIDGKWEDASAITGLITYDNNLDLQIGRFDSVGQYFDGFIDEVAVYSQALLSSQVQQLYAQGLRHHQLVRQVSN